MLLSNAQLHHALEDRGWQCGQLEIELSALREKSTEQTERLQSAKAASDVQARELHALKGALQAKERELAQTQRAMDAQQQHVRDVEADLAAYKRALDDERTRHGHELAELSEERLREEERLRSVFSRLSFLEVSMRIALDARASRQWTGNPLSRTCHATGARPVPTFPTPLCTIHEA